MDRLSISVTDIAAEAENLETGDEKPAGQALRGGKTAMQKE